MARRPRAAQGGSAQRGAGPAGPCEPAGQRSRSTSEPYAERERKVSAVRVLNPRRSAERIDPELLDLGSPDVVIAPFDEQGGVVAELEDDPDADVDAEVGVVQ